MTCQIYKEITSRLLLPNVSMIESSKFLIKMAKESPNIPGLGSFVHLYFHMFWKSNNIAMGTEKFTIIQFLGQIYQPIIRKEKTQKKI